MLAVTQNNVGSSLWIYVFVYMYIRVSTDPGNPGKPGKRPVFRKYPGKPGI